VVSLSPNNRIEPTAMSSRFATCPPGAVAHPCRSAASAMGWLGVRPAASRAARRSVQAPRACGTAGCRRALLRFGAMQEVQPCEHFAGVSGAQELPRLASCRGAGWPVSEIER